MRFNGLKNGFQERLIILCPIQAKKGMWLQDSYPAAFSLKLMLKDIRLANNEAGEAIKLPFLSKAEELYSQAEKSGLGALDMVAVYHYLEKGDY